MDSKRKRLLIFIGGYAPAKKYGGPVTSILNLTESIDCECYVVCSDHDFGSKEKLEGISEGWNKVGKANVVYLSEIDFNVDVFSRIIRELRPDCAYLQGIWHLSLTWPAKKALDKTGVPVVLSARGDLCEGAFNQKRLKKMLGLAVLKASGHLKNLIYHSTSPEETESIVNRLGVSRDVIHEIPNLGAPCLQGPAKIKHDGELRCVFVSRITRKKNLIMAVKSVELCRRNVYLDIYGPIEDEAYYREVIDCIEKAGMKDRIAYKGALDGARAKTIFRNYDCFLFPTLSENFGHVIAESLACGCPVVISQGVTPWDDLDGQAGFVCKLNEPVDFAKKLDEMSAMNSLEFASRFKTVRDYYRNKMGWGELTRSYYDMFFNKK